eukprot:5932182-Pleurochrysis_carterae.AAC.1
MLLFVSHAHASRVLLPERQKKKKGGNPDAPDANKAMAAVYFSYAEAEAAGEEGADEESVAAEREAAAVRKAKQKQQQQQAELDRALRS